MTWLVIIGLVVWVLVAPESLGTALFFVLNLGFMALCVALWVFLAFAI